MTTREVEKLIRHNYSSQFGGEFPEIKHANGKSEEEIKSEFENAVFITLPIAHDGRVAYDGMVYTEAFNDKIIQTMNTGNLGGNETHLESMEGRSSPPVLWLGASRDENGVVWAKGFVWDHRLGEFFKAVKVAHSTIGTSIFGYVTDFESLVFHDEGTFEVKPEGFTLLNIDLVPSGQEGLKFEERGLLQVSASTDFVEKEKETKMELNEVISALREMTEDELRNIPKSVRHVLTQIDSIDNEREAELTRLKGEVSDRDSKLVEHREVISTLSASLLEERLDRVIAQNVNVTGDAGEALKDFIHNAIKSQVSEAPETFEEVNALVESVMEKDSYKVLAQAVVDSASGGKAIVGVKDSMTSGNSDRDKDIDDAVKHSVKLLRESGASKTLRIFQEEGDE